MVGVSLGIVLIAEDSEGEEGDVDIAGIEDRVDEISVRGRFLCIEVDSTHPGDASGGEGGHRLVAGGRRPAGEDDPTNSRARQRLDGLEGDLARAAEDEDGLGLTEGVVHRDSLLARSDVNRPPGSIRSRIACHSARRGYVRASMSGAWRESLAR